MSSKKPIIDKASALIRNYAEITSINTILSSPISLYKYTNAVYINYSTILQIFQPTETYIKLLKPHILIINKIRYLNVSYIHLLPIAKQSAEQFLIYKIINRAIAEEFASMHQRYTSIVEEFQIYKNVADNNQTQYEDAEKNLSHMQADYYMLENSYADLKASYDKTYDELSSVNKEFIALKEIAKKLARYVKLQPSKSVIKDKVLSDLYDICEESDDDIESLDDSSAISASSSASSSTFTSSSASAICMFNDAREQAVVAKQTLMSSKKITKKKSDEIKPYFILRSACSQFSDSAEIFEWSITDTLPNNIDDYKKYSQDFALGDMANPEYDMLWHSDIRANIHEVRIISHMLEITNHMSEANMIRMLKNVLAH